MFKQIPFGDGRYWINEEGIVISTRANKILSYYLNNKGYKAIRLCYKMERRSFLIHRLVAQLFLPNPNNLPVVLHKDNNPLNCHVSNLKWGTQSENVQQAYDDGIGGGARKIKYQIYNPTSPVLIECIGAREISERIHRPLTSVQDTIRRGSPIYRGPFKGWEIKKVERSETIP